MKKVDLHIHTSASDGLLAPFDILELARKGGIETIAVTDHDTISGIEESLKADSLYPSVAVIPGIEFSVRYSPGDLHLVGLFIDHTNPALLSKVNELSLARSERGRRIVDDLRSAGINIEYDEVVREAAGGAIGKPHVARVLVRHGYAADFQDVFTKYLEKGTPGFAPKKKVEIEEAISLVKEASGIPILAHPVSLGLENYDEYYDEISRFTEIGLEGIEVYASMHSKNDVKLFSLIAEDLELLISGGSDFHGDKKEKLGYYGGGRRIPAEKLSRKFLEHYVTP